MRSHISEREELSKALEASRMRIRAATCDFLVGARKQIHASHDLTQTVRQVRKPSELYLTKYEVAKNA